MSESRTRVTFGAGEKLAVPVFMGTTFIEEFIKSIHPAWRTIVAQHPPQVQILIVHEVKTEAEKDTSNIRQNNYHDQALLVMPTSSEPGYIKITRQEFLRVMHETPVLDSTQAAILIEVNHHEKVDRSHACVTAKVIKDVYQGRLF